MGVSGGPRDEEGGLRICQADAKALSRGPQEKYKRLRLKEGQIVGVVVYSGGA